MFNNVSLMNRPLFFANNSERIIITSPSKKEAPFAAYGNEESGYLGERNINSGFSNLDSVNNVYEQRLEDKEVFDTL